MLAITLIAPVILANSRFDVTYTHTRQREPSLFLPMQTLMIGKVYLASVYVENEIYRNWAGAFARKIPVSFNSRILFRVFDLFEPFELTELTENHFSI